MKLEVERGSLGPETLVYHIRASDRKKSYAVYNFATKELTLNNFWQEEFVTT
jgi:hypothetical protein